MTEGAEDDQQSTVRPNCFEDEAAVEAFDLAFTRLVAGLHRKYTNTLVPPENSLRYNHGIGRIKPLTDGDPEVEMKTISVFTEVPYQILANNDLSILLKNILKIVRSMNSQFAAMVYGAVGDAAARVGNTTDARDHPSLAESFLDAIGKISFGVDRDGNVSRPEFHVGPSAGDKLIATLESQPPEFKQKVDEIIAKKSEEALAEESERKSRFKKPNSNV